MWTLSVADAAPFLTKSKIKVTKINKNPIWFFFFCQS